MAVTKGSWDRYADFLRERNEMANKDWLSMRDQVRKGGREVWGRREGENGWWLLSLSLRAGIS